MENGKTIKQIADEIGVSKQAVQKRIAREPLHSSVYAYIDKVGGILYIAYTGEKLIKQAFSEGDCIQVADNQPTTMYTPNNTLYDILKNELEAKNKQIDELTNELEKEREHSRKITDKMAVLAEQAQQLHGADKALELKEAQEPMLLEEKKPKQRWKFWGK